jgi:type I restriction enzyme, S subunit
LTTNQHIKELPPNWKWVKLGEFVISTKGKKPKNISKVKTEQFHLPYVNIKAFEKNIIDEFTDGVGCVLCNDGDFLMVWDGSRSGYVGKAINGALGSTLVKLNFPDIENNYAYYFLQSKYLEINTRAKGVGIPHVDPSILWNYDLLIPPLPTQQAIVAKIETLFAQLDNGIQQLKTAQQQLKIYRQAVLKYAFEGKLTKEWRNVKKIEIDRKFWSSINTSKYKIGFELYQPSLWIVLPIGNFSDFQQGMQIAKKTRLKNKEEGSLPILRIKNYRDGFKSDVEYIKVDESSLIAKKEDIILTRTGESRGDILTGFKGIFHNNTFRINYPKSHLNREFLIYYLSTSKVQNYIKNNSGRTGQPDLTHRNFGPCPIVIPPIEEQQLIVQAIESRLSVADKMEESISQSLLQAEVLRQSILKKAFEGRLVVEEVKEEIKEALVVPMYTPKSTYFYQVQILATVIRASQKNNIQHGEMTLAKNAYLIDKVFGIPTMYNYKQWHLGPYAPEMKTAVKKKDFFIEKNGYLQIANEEKIFKAANPYIAQTEAAINELCGIFNKYPQKDKAHKTELLATICKAVEDIQTTNLATVRQAMQNWKINLKTTAHKNKAEKFTEKETKDCLDFIISKGWDKKLIKWN